MVKDKDGLILSPIGSLLDKGTSNIKLKDVEAITKFMGMASRGTVLEDASQLFKDGRDAVDSLNNIFGRQFSTKNKISILNIIYDIMENASLEGLDKQTKRFWGDLANPKTIKQAYNKTKNYPIDMLRHAINLPEFKAEFGMSDYRTGAPKEDPDVFGEGGSSPRAEKKLLEGMDEDLYEAFLKLDKLFDEFHKMDEVNVSLLYAHDTIRKMKDKDIIKSYLSLTNVDQMGLVINKIHREHRMDVTATEVDKIVKSVSSYESISRNYGINEEVVYTIKAMFR